MDTKLARSRIESATRCVGCRIQAMAVVRRCAERGEQLKCCSVSSTSRTTEDFRCKTTRCTFHSSSAVDQAMKSKAFHSFAMKLNVDDLVALSAVSIDDLHRGLEQALEKENHCRNCRRRVMAMAELQSGSQCAEGGLWGPVAALRGCTYICDTNEFDVTVSRFNVHREEEEHGCQSDHFDALHWAFARLMSVCKTAADHYVVSYDAAIATVADCATCQANVKKGWEEYSKVSIADQTLPCFDMRVAAGSSVVFTFMNSFNDILRASEEPLIEHLRTFKDTKGFVARVLASLGLRQLAKHYVGVEIDWRAEGLAAMGLEGSVGVQNEIDITDIVNELNILGSQSPTKKHKNRRKKKSKACRERDCEAGGAESCECTDGDGVGGTENETACDSGIKVVSCDDDPVAREEENVDAWIASESTDCDGALVQAPTEDHDCKCCWSEAAELDLLKRMGWSDGLKRKGGRKSREHTHLPNSECLECLELISPDVVRDCRRRAQLRFEDMCRKHRHGAYSLACNK